MQGIEQLVPCGGGRQLEPEFLRQRRQKILGAQIGVGNAGGDTFALQAAQQLVAQHRLAGADLAHDFQKALTATQRHQQGVQCGLRAFVRIEESGVGRDRERRLAHCARECAASEVATRCALAMP
jgi:hypothetical protein